MEAKREPKNHEHRLKIDVEKRWEKYGNPGARAWGGKFAEGARGCPIILTEDNQTEENLTNFVTSRKVKCEKINYEDKLQKDKPRRILTRPGRLRAQSGYIGPKGPEGFPAKAARYPPDAILGRSFCSSKNH